MSRGIILDCASRLPLAGWPPLVLRNAFGLLGFGLAHRYIDTLRYDRAMRFPHQFRRHWSSMVLATVGVLLLVGAIPVTRNGVGLIFSDGFENGLEAWSSSTGGGSGWALFETFDGDPGSPSQDLLPTNFDYVVTHRTHPRNHLPAFPSYPADHDNTCAGPVPEIITGEPEPQHDVVTRHDSNGGSPDPSFFVCKDHMMSSMGEVDGYSVTSFYPRQEFDFANGGVLEFDVNINDSHPRSWWEILIAPRHQMKVGAARSWLPIDETYPRDRIVLEFSPNSVRTISVGKDEVAPNGWQVDEHDWRDWRFAYPDDPALDDRRIRRTMRIELNPFLIRWGIETAAGEMDWYEVPVPQGLPFDRGLVMFKTHAYTPEKDDNYHLYTYHWDNLRWDGPVVGRFDVYEASGLVYLQANGSRDVGETESTSIDLSDAFDAQGNINNPTLFGQLHSPMTGQVELAINGGPYQAVHPIDYANDEDVGPDCLASGWSSFVLPLDPDQLVASDNTFLWRIGPRPACATTSWLWDGFSVKSLEVQVDR